LIKMLEIVGVLTQQFSLGEWLMLMWWTIVLMWLVIGVVNHAYRAVSYTRHKITRKS